MLIPRGRHLSFWSHWPAGRPKTEETMALSSILSGTQKSRVAAANPFILVQSSSTATALPVLQKLVESNEKSGSVVLVTALYAPEDLLGPSYKNDLPGVRVLDWTYYVPGYSDEEHGYDRKLTEVEDEIKGVSRAH